MSNFLTYYTESVLDLPRNSLDPKVFQFADGMPPVLNPAIKSQIESGLSEISRIVPVKNAYVIGSILTRNYSEKSDIDVTVEVYAEDIDLSMSSLAPAKLMDLLKRLNGHMAVGTTHPINYYITVDFDDGKADAVYDVRSEKWLKEPSIGEIQGIEGYLKAFEDMVASVDTATGKLRRDIIDYKELERMDSSDIVNLHTKISNKLYEINKTVESLTDFKKDIKSKRRAAFDSPMTPDEITKYSSKNLLPANVIYKLFQKYYYWDLIDKLDGIIDNRDKSNEYVDDLDSLVGYSESEFSDFVTMSEGIRPLKLTTGSVNWKDPTSKRKYRDATYKAHRSMTRQNLSQVPDTERMVNSHRSLSLAKKIVQVAKDSPSGLWRITPMQAREIAQTYHHIMPNARKPTKHIGNTGIVVWRKGKNKYYLVKHRSL